MQWFAQKTTENCCSEQHPGKFKKSLATTEKTLNNNSNNNKNKTEDPLKIFPVIFNRPKQFFFHCT